MTDNEIYQEAMERENTAPFPQSYKTTFYDGAKWMQKKMLAEMETLKAKACAYDRIMQNHDSVDYE